MGTATDACCRGKIGGEEYYIAYNDNNATATATTTAATVRRAIGPRGADPTNR
jgi:hypothetical protein